MSLSKLKRTLAQLAWLNGTGPNPRASMRPTPREVLARHLTRDHGMTCCAEDIWWVKGYWSHDHQDCTERGRVSATDNKTGRKVEITLIDPVTLCARHGVTLEKNTDGAHYGDYVAEANHFDCKSR